MTLLHVCLYVCLCVHDTAEPLDGVQELPDTQTAQQTDVNETYSPLLLRLVRPAMPPPPRRLFVRPRSENVKRGSERARASVLPLLFRVAEAPPKRLRLHSSSPKVHTVFLTFHYSTVLRPTCV